MAGRIPALMAQYLEEFLQEEGLELYHAEYVKEGKDHVLRIVIDTQEKGTYITSDDCEKVSHFLDSKLEAEDPIDGPYNLEVSSPGMDRLLYTEHHFDKFKGEPVDVKLYKAIDGQKNMTGILGDQTEDTLVLLPPDEKQKGLIPQAIQQVQTLPLAAVASVRLTVVI